MNFRLCYFVLFICFVPIVNSQTILTIEPSTTYQVIDGFGASDCWTANFVGKYWQNKEKEKAAKWLFSTGYDKAGNPAGIGLSIWRFNLGGGTVEQGDSSNIKDITRRAECFLDNKGHYDWTKQAGQQWFLEKATSYGCKFFVAFSNTPPVLFTRNGHGFGLKDGKSNLKPDKYDAYANYLVTVANHFQKNKNIVFDYLSPVNEPQWNWDGTYQEGSPWHNSEIKQLVELLDVNLKATHCNSKIMITEAGSWDRLYRKVDRASNQISEFFDTKSANYLGKVEALDGSIAGHSYWTDTNDKRIKEIRDSVWQKATQYKLKVHQTEWSLLSVPPMDGFPKSYKDATYTDIALYMAKIIYADLAYANVSTWSFWTAMDVEMNGFKNRFNLIRLHTTNDDGNKIKSGGTVSAMKNLWVLGNYSLFIRPGYKRICITGADDLAALMGVSFISPDTKKIVTVLTNNSKKPIEVSLVLPKSYESKIINVDSYITDQGSDLKYASVSAINSLLLPQKSVTTVVYSFK